MIARHPTLATYDALATPELALLLRQGGTLPANAWRRAERLREAVRLMADQDRPGRPPTRGEAGYREHRDRQRAREIRELYEGRQERTEQGEPAAARKDDDERR